MSVVWRCADEVAMDAVNVWLVDLAVDLKANWSFAL